MKKAPRSNEGRRITLSDFAIPRSLSHCLPIRVERGRRVTWRKRSAVRHRIPNAGTRYSELPSWKPDRRSSNAPGLERRARKARRRARSTRSRGNFARRTARSPKRATRSPRPLRGKGLRNVPRRQSVPKLRRRAGRRDAHELAPPQSRRRSRRSNRAAVPSLCRSSPRAASSTLIPSAAIEASSASIGTRFAASWKTSGTEALDRFDGQSIFDTESGHRLPFVTDPNVILEHEAELDLGPGFYKRREEVARFAA